MWGADIYFLHYSRCTRFFNGLLSGHIKGLEGVNLSYPDSDVWNIAHWTIKR